MFGLFDSLRASMGPHVREGVKDMIFILNPNPTNLSFRRIGRLIVLKREICVMFKESENW